MREFEIGQTGYYSIVFYDPSGLAIYPDWDSNLKIEFYDSSGTLRFTATISSSPSLTKETDNEGRKYVGVSGIDLTGWDTGVVLANTYASFDGENIYPYPTSEYAFEITTSGYAGVNNIIEFTGVQPSMLSKSTSDELAVLLHEWDMRVKAFIDNYTNNSWDDPPGDIKLVALRAVANIIGQSIAWRQNPIISEGDLGTGRGATKQGDVFTESMLKVLDEHRSAAEPGKVYKGLGLGIGCDWTGRDE